MFYENVIQNVFVKNSFISKELQKHMCYCVLNLDLEQKYHFT